MKYIHIVAIFLGIMATAYGDGTNSPATDPVIARVLDRNILLSEQTDLNGIIFGALMERYSEGCAKPTQADIAPFVESTERHKTARIKDWETERDELSRQLESDALSESERSTITSNFNKVDKRLKMDAVFAEKAASDPEDSRKTEERIAESFVRAWKVNLALYEQYGGRVIFQQAGVEPLDAYRLFLQEQEAAGNFQILDKQYEASFWNYFTNDTMHSFYPTDEGDKFMRTPWWLSSEKPEE